MNTTKEIIELARVMLKGLSPVRIDQTNTFLPNDQMPEWGNQIIDKCNHREHPSLIWIGQFMHQTITQVAVYNKTREAIETCRSDKSAAQTLKWLAHDTRMLDYEEKLTTKQKLKPMLEMVAAMQVLHKREVAGILITSLRIERGHE